MTPDHIWLLENKGLAILEKRKVKFTKHSATTYKWLKSTPLLKNTNVSEPEVVKYLADKDLDRGLSWCKETVMKHIPGAMIFSIISSCDWNNNTLFSKLGLIKYSPITGRIYYPYNRMTKKEREKIKGWDYVSVDAHASQLVILANELQDLYPGNSFSQLVLTSHDIFESLKPHINKTAYLAWLDRMQISGDDAEVKAAVELRTFFDEEFDGNYIPKRTMKSMVYRIVFGGATQFLNGFPELKEYVAKEQGKYNNDVSNRYRFANKTGYHYLKNLASIISCKESKVMHECAAALSAVSIRYQIVHDGFDIERSRVAEAQSILQSVVFNLKIMNYRFVIK